MSYSDQLDCGVGPAPVGSIKRGVNGLYDMGANVSEWVDGGKGDQKVTAEGSWWYGIEMTAQPNRKTQLSSALDFGARKIWTRGEDRHRV